MSIEEKKDNIMPSKKELEIMYKELNANEDLQVICNWKRFGMK